MQLSLNKSFKPDHNNGVGNGTVRDIFLAQVSKEISILAEDLLEMFINYKSIEKSAKESYEMFVINNLKSFGHNCIIFKRLVYTFSYLAKTDPNRNITKLNNFLPQIFANYNIDVDLYESFLSPLPMFPREPDELGYAIGFLSEFINQQFLNSLLEVSSNIDEEQINLICQRIFSIVTSKISVHFLFNIVCLSLEGYKPIVNKITNLNASIFSYFCSDEIKRLLKQKKDPNPLILFFKVFSGQNFEGTGRYLDIRENLFTILKNTNTFLINNRVTNAFCECFSEILPVIKDKLENVNFGEMYQNFYKLLKRKDCWKSSLRLIGVMHYIKLPEIDQNYQNFLNKYVIKRLRKPHKISGALDYFVSALKPSSVSTYNWSGQILRFADIVYNILFQEDCSDINYSGYELKAAEILVGIATLELDNFTSRLPNFLSFNNQITTITLIALQKILNPITKFTDIANTVPTNVTKGSHRHVLTIIEIMSVELASIISRCDFERNQKYCYNLIPFTEIYKTIEFPNFLEKNKTNQEALHMINIWRTIKPINDDFSKTSKIFMESDSLCNDLISKWVQSFDTPYRFLGNLLDRSEYVTDRDIKYEESKELNILPLMMIVLNRNPDKIEYYSKFFIEFISTNDAYISGYASFFYQLLFFLYPEHSLVLLKSLIDKCFDTLNKCAFSTHQLIVVFSHCIKMCPTSILSETTLLESDFLALTALCLPFAESHIVGFDIMKHNSIIKNNVVLSDTHVLHDVINDNIYEIEQKILTAIFSEYSTWTESKCPIYKLPVIPIRVSSSSGYQLLWRFTIVKIVEVLMSKNLERHMILFRKNFLEISNFVTAHEFPDIENNLLITHTNIISCLFATTTTEISLKPELNEQKVRIEKLIDTASNICLRLSIEKLKVFSFVFTALNMGSLSKAISSFLRNLINEKIDLRKREKNLAVFASMLRHVSMQPSFDSYVIQMQSEGQIQKIFSIFDCSFKMYLNFADETYHDNLFPYMEQFSHFLVFRGQYFRYLHQSNQLNHYKCLQRCAITKNISDEDISPILSPDQLFLLLFNWSLIDNMIDEQKLSMGKFSLQDDFISLVSGFSNSARSTLSYLASLRTFFVDEDFFNDMTLDGFTKIGLKKPSFLRYILTKHYDILIEPFIKMALSNEIKSARFYFNAIVQQFIAPHQKDSLIYTHNTFLKTKSTRSVSSTISDGSEDCSFTKNAFLQTGSLILLSLFYLLHDESSARQYSLRMFCSIIPHLLLLNNNGNKEDVKCYIDGILEYTQEVVKQNLTLRVYYAVEISKLCSKYFKFATQQVLKLALLSITSTHLQRDICSREQLLQIVIPWISNVNVTLKKGNIDYSNPFIFFGPYSLIQIIVRCSEALSSKLSFEPLWNALISANKGNIFIIISLIDIAISDKSLMNQVREILTYSYRIDDTTIDVIFNYLGYGQWYFENVQLGKFEEITDLSEFLSIRSKYNQLTNETKPDVAKYVLTILANIISEEIDGITRKFHVIIVFCLNHIHMYESFQLLYSLVKAINSTMRDGSPRYLHDLHKYLSQIDSVQYDLLRHTIQTEESPARALQNRSTSLSYLLDLFINVGKVFEIDSLLDNISSDLLLWGLSCGDLMIASRSLDLYSSMFSTEDPTIINHILENAIVTTISYLISVRNSSNLRSTFFADYLASIFRTLKVIVRHLSKENSLYNHPLLFWLPVLFISLNTQIFKSISEVTVTYLSLVINEWFVDANHNTDILFSTAEKINCKDIDFKNIVKIISIPLKHAELSTKTFLNFIFQITKLPRKLLALDGNLSLYGAILGPFILASVENPQNFSNLCKFSDFKKCLTRIKNFYNDKGLSRLIKSFKSGTIETSDFSQKFLGILLSNPDKETVEDIAIIYSSLLKHTDYVSIGHLYDFSSVLISILPTEEILKKLYMLSNEATTNLENGNVVHRIKYLMALAANPDLKLQMIESSDTYNPDINDNIGIVFHNMYDTISKTLHLNLKALSETKRVRFTDVNLFPPLIPFTKDILSSDFIKPHIDMCRMIEVDPQTNWSLSIYGSQYENEHLDQSKLKLNLDLNLDINEVISEYQTEKENSAQAISSNPHNYNNVSNNLCINFAVNEIFEVPKTAFLLDINTVLEG